MNTALVAVLGSALLHPFVAATAKKAAHPLTINFWAICLATLLFSPHLFALSYWDTLAQHWELVTAMCLLHSFYVVLVLHLILKHEFQVLYPLTRLAPIFILLGEIVFLQTTFSWWQIGGIFCVLMGALIFALDRKIKHLRVEILSTIFLITLLVGGYHLVDKKLIEVFTPGEFWALIIFQIPIMIPFVWHKKEALKKDLKAWKRLLFFAACMVGTWYLALVALQQLPAAVMASARNLSIIFGVFLGGKLFDEGHAWLRYMAAVLIVIGAGLAVRG